MRNFKLFFLMIATIGMVSCGGEKKEENDEVRLTEPVESTEAEVSEAENEEGEKTAANGEVVEITIEANDQMQFNKKEIKVKAGQTVKLTLKHVGNLEEKVMGHNWVLLKKGTEVAEFGNAAASARDNDFIPKGTDKVIANTEMIGGGETTTIEFQAPAAGTYDFICSFPGHFAVMNGKFIVE